MCGDVQVHRTLLWIAIVLAVLTPQGCAAEDTSVSAVELLNPDVTDSSDVGADSGDAVLGDVSVLVDAPSTSDLIDPQDGSTDGSTSSADSEPQSDGDVLGEDALASDVDLTDTDASAAAGQCLSQSDQDQLTAVASINIFKWAVEQGQDCFYELGGTFTTDVPDDEYYACMVSACSSGLGISGVCADCFAEVALCSKTFCKITCGGDMSSTANLEKCSDCQVENYCTHTFNGCTGLVLYGG